MTLTTFENVVISDNLRIWTVKTGRGFPVMLCNGGPGCCDYLEPVAQMLDDMAKVVRFEQRGCGRSDFAPPYDIETCVPALFVYGERDIRPSWPTEQIAHLMPNARFELIRDAEHVIWASHQHELRALLREFVGHIC